jgi:hypothetical protein
MYLTWDAGKVFIGITGQALIDPNETNRLYVVFDFDPEGENGSNTPPENAGGVGSYPVNADVVIMVESWNQADYMIGAIYKWSGSSWSSSEYDGDIAAQGVLAYADEGEERLAEVAAVRNEPGIGTDFTSLNLLVYVAEQGTSGEVLAAFPDGNAVGNGVSFTQYFYMDSLASGLFPTDPDHVQIKGQASAIDQQRVIKPEDFHLEANFPNPFNPSTTIRYHLPKAATIKLELYDVSGRLVDVLMKKRQNAGSYDHKFTANQLSSGVYFYKLVANEQTIRVRKMVLLK